MVEKPKDWARAAWGCCKGAWSDNPQDYLRQEHDSWKDDTDQEKQDMNACSTNKITLPIRKIY